MDRDKIYEELRKNVKEESVLKHLLATEAVMKGMARFFNEDEEIWGIAGLVHDIDYEKTKNVMKFHGIQGAETLKKLGLPDVIINAVKAHNPLNNSERNTLIEKVLYAVDPLSGLITACALIKGKKIENVDVEFVISRFKEKRFAKGANREIISSCTEFGLSLEEFIRIALDKMKEIQKELGL